MDNAKATKIGLAKRLRKNATIAEAKLWRKLRARELNGFKFVRQEPIGHYVADFVCREHRLIIEVDGGQHVDSERDMVRDAWLREHRYRVLRFWNNDVIENLEGVLETILAALPVEAPPHPNPLPACGDRE